MYINRWVLILLIIPHLEVYYFQLPIIDPVITIARILTLVIALFIMIRGIGKLELLVLLFFLIIIASSIMNNNLTLGSSYRLFILFGFIVFLSNQLKFNFKELILSLYYIFTILIILNLFSVLIGGLGYSETGSEAFFLGRKNHLIFSTIPYITIIYTYSYTFYNRLKLKYFFLIILSLASVVLAGSGTGIIISIVFMIFIIFPNFLYPSMYVYLFIYAFFFLSIVIYRLHEKWLGFIIVDILDKDITFSGRTLLWDISIEAIRDKWILGYGRGNTIISDTYWYLNEAHNGLLEIGLDSGILGIIIFSAILLIVAKKLNKYKVNKIAKIISLSIFLFLLTGLSESIFLLREFWIVLILGYSIQYIVKFQKQ